MKIKENNTCFLSFTIKNLIKNNAYHNDLNKLLKLINSKTFSSSLNKVLNNNTISNLNNLKHKIQQDIEKNKPLYENKLVTLTFTIIITEFIKKLLILTQKIKIFGLDLWRK